MKRVLRCGAVTVAVVALLAGCSTSGSPKSDSANVVSVSVPADVPKDSIRDLNSTKDMSGVVTTIPENQSPYVGNLPEICPFLPKKPLEALGAKKIVPNILSDYIQSCRFQPDGIEGWGAATAIFTITKSDYRSNAAYKVIRDGISLPSQNVGFMLRPTVGIDSRECVVAWGTFYGVAETNYNASFRSSENECDRALAYAKVAAQYLPNKPSQMRRKVER